MIIRGLVPLIKGTQRALLLLPNEDTGRRPAIYELEEPSPDTRFAGSLTLDFQPQEL